MRPRKPRAKLKPREPLKGADLFRRLEEIYGIPMQKPTITWGRNKYARQMDALTGWITAGSYNPSTHHLNIVIPMEKIINHEMIHAADNLVNKQESGGDQGITKRGIRYAVSMLGLPLGGYPKAIWNFLKGETIAGLAEKERPLHFFQRDLKLPALKTMGITPAAGLLWNFLGPAGALLIAPLYGRVIGQVIEARTHSRPVQMIYDKHGQDGILLFLTNPPRVFGTIETYLWERKMRRKGLLKETGGITEKGIEVMRKKMPKERILKRIEQMKRNANPR